MNRKDPIPSYKIVAAGDLSAATVTSPVTQVNYHDNLVYQCNITGSPVGTLAMQASDDYLAINTAGGQTNVINAGNWVTISGMTAAVTTAETIIFDCNQLAPMSIRLLYTKTSGTGAIDIYVSGKQV